MNTLDSSSPSSKHGSFSFLAKSQKPATPEEGKDPADSSEKSDNGEEPANVTEQLSDEPIKALQRDVDHVYREVDRCTEYTLVAMSSIAAILSFAELLNDKETFAKASMWAHEMSQDFISNTLKTVWDLLNKEIPQKTSLAALRDPSELKELLVQLSVLRAVDGVAPKLRVRKLYQKFATIQEFFRLVDIHIFPNFAQVHSEGKIN